MDEKRPSWTHFTVSIPGVSFEHSFQARDTHQTACPVESSIAHTLTKARTFAFRIRIRRTRQTRIVVYHSPGSRLSALPARGPQLLSQANLEQARLAWRAREDRSREPGVAEAMALLLLCLCADVFCTFLARVFTCQRKADLILVSIHAEPQQRSNNELSSTHFSVALSRMRDNFAAGMSLVINNSKNEAAALN